MKDQLKTVQLITFSLVAASLFLFACSSEQSNEADKSSNAIQVNQEKARPYDISKNEKANMKLVNEYVDAMMNANADKVKSLVNEGFKEYGPAAKDSMTVDEALAFWENVNKTSADQKAGTLYMIAIQVNEGPLKGDWLDVWGNYTAIDKETKENIIIPWHSAFFIENNKISSRRSWWDNLAPSLQLGNVAVVEK